MANENKKINELVSDEDETAELEAATFRQDDAGHSSLAESDDSTFDFEQQAEREATRISRLQYDVEQLRSKWLGVEAELRAREEITDRLNAELAEVRDKLARKEKLIKTRDSKIKALKAEIRDREEHNRVVTRDLQDQLDKARRSVDALPEPPPDDASAIPFTAGDISGMTRLARIEEYADLLRRKLQDVLAQHDDVERDRRRLSDSLARAEQNCRSLEAQVALLWAERDEVDNALADAARAHEEEIRMLRFELGEAQETVAQTEELNSQLASDLLDTRGFKQELERKLCDTDEEARARIAELEEELSRVTTLARELEERLDARSDAIDVLLSELARKSDQMESIDELSDVIFDLDEQISGQFDEADNGPSLSQRSPDRVTRVLLGKIGDKVLRFPLFKDRLTIGRTADNDIQLNAPYISRKHAVVSTDGETTRVIDWGSRNGVYVNSRRVTEHFLKSGDIVTIGNAHFRYDERPKRDI
jgi:chromosome segregation ATPase